MKIDTKKRCFSKCRGLTRKDCVKPCSFVNERYCRLSSTLKMVPPDCHAIKRMNPKIKGKSKEKKIKLKLKRRTLINTICSDKGICIEFGKKRKSFFSFQDFTYAVSMKTIHDLYDIKEIKYEKDGYIAHAYLKSGKKSDESINLAYEYLVGQFINEMAKKTTLFLETYGLYIYPDKKQRSLIQKDQESSSQLHVNLATSLIPISPDKLAMVCGNPELECILLQNIKDAKPLTHFVKNSHFFIYDSLYVFYQVYFTLSMLRKVFTHYNLQCNHTLLYQPLQNGYIEYYYHLPKEVVQFKSPYLVKIKDYSHSFFKGSDKYYDLLCQEPRCDPQCGKNSGFYLLNENNSKKNDKQHVNSLKKNESYDLRLLKEYQQLTHMKSHANKYIQSFVQVFEDIIYSETESDINHEPLTQSDKIHNVNDVEKRLRRLIQDPVRQRINKLSYAKYKKIGDLHVYTNGKEVEFISQKNI